MSPSKPDAPVRLRPMLQADIAQVLRLERQCHPTQWPGYFFRCLLRRKVRCWVFVQAGAVIGYGIVRCLRQRAHIMNLCIARGRRRRGLGRRMLLHLMHEARRHGAELAWLEVHPANSVAISLYRRHGFVGLARRRGYYRRAGQRRGDALVMSRRL